MNCNPCNGTGSGSIIINNDAALQIQSYDAFNNQYVDGPTTIFVTHNAFNEQFNVLDYRSTGTGFTFVDVSNSLTQLGVSHTAGRSIRQSREYLLYLPGKSQLVYVTLTPHYTGTFDNNVAVRAGIFDDYRDKNTAGSTPSGNPLGKEVNQKSMGHFFELSGNKWFVVERYNSSDNVTNVTRVPQSEWNIDTVDGNINTSKSGYILSDNPTSGILLVIDRQWLGVGIVRMGLYYNAKIINVHAFQNRTIGTPYTHLPKLPIRWEIERTSTIGAAPSSIMAAICGSGQVGGTYIPFGNLYGLPITIITTDIPVDQTLRPVLLLRLQQRYCRATIKLKSLELVNTNTNNADAGYQITRNPIISGPAYTWTRHPDPNSMVEYHVFDDPVGDGYTTLSGGYTTRSGYFTARSQFQDDLSVEELVTSPSYCSDIYGNSDIICLSMIALKSTGGNLAVRASFRWLEIS